MVDALVLTGGLEQVARRPNARHEGEERRHSRVFAYAVTRQLVSRSKYGYTQGEVRHAQRPHATRYPDTLVTLGGISINVIRLSPPSTLALLTSLHLVDQSRHWFLVPTTLPYILCCRSAGGVPTARPAGASNGAGHRRTRRRHSRKGAPARRTRPGTATAKQRRHPAQKRGCCHVAGAARG